MGMEHVDGKIQSGVKPPQSKKQGSGRRGRKIEATLGRLTRISVAQVSKQDSPARIAFGQGWHAQPKRGLRKNLS
jgi:hypothetical protein